jgi:hypothetical protein
MTSALVSTILFFIVAILVGRIALSYALTMFKAIEVLEQAHYSMGRTYNYWDDHRLRLRLLFKPNSVVDEDEPPPILSAKKNLVAVRKTAFAHFLEALQYLIGGTAVSMAIVYGLKALGWVAK